MAAFKTSKARVTNSTNFYAWKHSETGLWLSGWGWVPDLRDAVIYDSPQGAMKDVLAVGSKPDNGMLIQLDVVMCCEYKNGDYSDPILITVDVDAESKTRKDPNG